MGQEHLRPMRSLANGTTLTERLKARRANTNLMVHCTPGLLGVPVCLWGLKGKNESQHPRVALRSGEEGWGPCHTAGASPEGRAGPEPGCDRHERFAFAASPPPRKIKAMDFNEFQELLSRSFGSKVEKKMN